MTTHLKTTKTPNLHRIPFAEIDTVFFDVGNTLISIDFEWVSEELATRGLRATPDALRRAEARARPELSAGLESIPDKESLGSFGFYFGLILAKLDPSDAEASRREELVRELAPVLRGPGLTQRLWSWLMPGVPEALASMAEAGLQLAVVSNSDGSVESSLVAAGLRDHFDAVLDSHLVGHEKPDPRIFEEALRRCRADPARTLHVGDLYAADVVGARAAGLHPVLLDPWGDWGETDCLRLPDIVTLGGRLCQSRSRSRSR